MEKIKISAELAASKAHAWECYTAPEHITKWNFADPSWHCPSASNDLRVGGIYNARMEAKDGSFGFDFEGTYDAVALGESLTYHLADNRQIDVRFIELETSKTLVEVDFDPEGQNPLEMQRGGWQMILNNYKSHCESLV